jgi:hypothetical protein
MRLAFLLPLLLSGCLSWLPGVGGTNVAANTQVGAQNNQAAVVGKIAGDTKVEAQDLGKLTQAEQAIEAGSVEISNIPPWVLLLLILGWLLPSPKEIWDGLWNIPNKLRGNRDAVKKRKQQKNHQRKHQEGDEGR